MKKVLTILSCLGILGFLILIALIYFGPSSNVLIGLNIDDFNPGSPWRRYPETASAKGPNGTFTLKAILVVPEEMQFFYAINSSIKGSLNVETLSTDTGCSPN